MSEKITIFKKTGLRFVISVFLLWITLGGMNTIFAKENELPNEICKVKNEKNMIDLMIKGMKKHESQFLFYYPGIDEDFEKYRQQSASYTTFIEKLAKKDGYITGVVSGYCITIQKGTNPYVNFQFCYLTTKNQERRINKQVKHIVKRIGNGSRVLKVKKAHDYLINHMSYDKRYYNPYYAFFKGKGMCMSYALAYQRILQEMKIPCIYIKGENHAWNMVKIGTYWYNVDVTWDDGKSGKYRYFLKSDSAFSGHKRPVSKWLSSLKKARHSYNLSKIY